MDTADDLLAKFKKHPFAKGLLPFGPTLKAIDSPFGKIVAKADGRQRWVVQEKTTGEPALFSHAAVFAESDDINTGNYVPSNEDIPPGIDVKVVQRRANSRCFYTYVMDTFADRSLYECQWALDDYMASVSGFNPRNLPRRPYLSGRDERYRSRFWFQTPMFLRSGGQATASGGVDHLHKWVIDADRQSRAFIANPDKPRVWVKDGDTTVPIGEREPGTLQRGDLVAFSFTVTYHVTNSNWFPQFHPADIVVIRSGDGEVTDYNAPTIGLVNRPPPMFEDVEDEKSSEETDVEDKSTRRIGAESAAIGDGIEGALSVGEGVVSSECYEKEVDGGRAIRRKRSSDTLDSSSDKDCHPGNEGGGEAGGQTEGEMVQGDDGRAGRGSGSKRSVRRRL